MRQEAWPIASDAREWPCMAGVLVVHEALVAAHVVLVVVRTRSACASARCRVASCCTRSLIASATSEWVCPASTGSEQPAESTRSAEEWCGDDAFDDD